MHNRNPFLAGAGQGNAHARESFGAIACEWQDFVFRRLKENLLLTQRLTRSRTADQVLAAFTDFWQKAAEDYGHEITTMSRLMAGVTTRKARAAHSDVDGASKNVFRIRGSGLRKLGR
jgi:Phasin protein